MDVAGAAGGWKRSGTCVGSGQRARAADAEAGVMGRGTQSPVAGGPR